MVDGRKMKYYCSSWTEPWWSDMVYLTVTLLGRVCKPYFFSGLHPLGTMSNSMLVITDKNLLSASGGEFCCVACSLDLHQVWPSFLVSITSISFSFMIISLVILYMLGKQVSVLTFHFWAIYMELLLNHGNFVISFSLIPWSSVIAGHNEAVLSVSFSPDGRQLASGSGDTTVRLWDLYTQTPLFTCKGHKNWVLCIAWSPDGQHLVSGSKAGELLCWNPRTGQPSGNPLIGHKKWITGISWEPLHLNAPCRRFVSASKDGDARIWDVSLKKCVMCLTGHTLAITCVKWGGDGIIYTGSQDCIIKMWETSQGKLIRELKGHGHWVNSLALSTEYILRTGAFDHTGKQYSSPEEMKKVALDRYNKMKGSGPERLVSGSDDFTMFLWEPAVSKHPKTRMTGHQQLVNHVYFSPDGQWIASASFDKSVKLWNGITGNFVAAFRGHVGPVYQISWSADSRLLLSGSKDSTLKVWDIRTQKLKQDLPGHADEVFAVDWSPDGEKVASGGKDKVLKLWMG